MTCAIRYKNALLIAMILKISPTTPSFAFYSLTSLEGISFV